MDKYEAKQRYVDNLMRKNAEIESLTPEQHNALESLAQLRHEFHTNCEALFYTSYAEYENLVGFFPSDCGEGKINEILKEAELPTIEFPDITYIPCDLDYLEFMDGEEREEWERKAEEVNENSTGKMLFSHTGFSLWIEESGAYQECMDTCAKINNLIECYLRNFDNNHGTQYAPTGFARLKY